MQWWAYLVLIASVLLGGSLAWFMRQSLRYVRNMLSFSGAYLLGIAILHFLPELLSEDPGLGIWILGGFLLQLFLEKLSSGVEHGHVHPVHGRATGTAIQVMVGLCLHTFLEGLPLGGYAHLPGHSVHDAGTARFTQQLLWGIVLHKIPSAFALATLLRISGFSRSFIFICLGIFSVTAPIAAFLAGYISFPGNTLTLLMAVVTGSFLHVATTILFESESQENHHLAWPKLVAILIGFSLAFLTLHD